ncbi:MAG: four helix bundle protein [Lewinella sp.]|nr:four helix bundle protein [Lewinella sp.]
MEHSNFNQSFAERTKQHALSVIRWYRDQAKKDEIGSILGKQLIRSVTSVAANFRAACRSRSVAEYYAKLCIVVEESDETLFWMECFQELEWIDTKALDGIMEETLVILKVMARAKKNALDRKATSNKD